MENKLNDEEYFQIELMIPEYGISEMVSYRKDSVKFESDYAIVRAFSKDPKYANYVWRGVIDKEFHTVVDFYLNYKLKLLPNNHLLKFETDYNSSGISRSWTWHSKLENGEELPKNLFGKCIRQVDDNLLVVESDFEDHDVFLYNIEKNKFISNRFTEIGEFKEVEGRRIALAKRKLKTPKNSCFTYPLEAMCYIDDTGEICSKLYNPITMDDDPIQKHNFEAWIEYLEQFIPTYQTEEEIATHLKRTLIRKNTTNNY